MATNVTARDVRILRGMLCLNAAFAAQNLHQSQRKAFLLASKQQRVASCMHNLPFLRL